jgi:hypothetical protein
MAFGSFKTLINVGMNTVNDYKVPVTRQIEKTKDYEIRVYEKTKYIIIKYKTIDKGANKNKNTENSKSKDKKEPNDQIMNNVWKIMKYTQGDNKSNLNMKFYMPVFVHIDTLTEINEQGEKEIEVKIMVALPPEYQNENEPPVPNEQDISFEIIDEFKCYVK